MFRNRSDGSAQERSDRTLAGLISAGGLVLVLGDTLPRMSQLSDFAPWWNLSGFLLIGAITLITVGFRRFKWDWLRLLWVGAPLLSVMLLVTSFAAYQGSEPDAVLPWIWSIEPVMVSFTVLWLAPGPAVGFALISALLPAVSGLLVLGRIPEATAVVTPDHLSNIGFVAIFLGIQYQLGRQRRAESARAEKERNRANQEALVRQRKSLARLVHDDVLSVFIAALALPWPTAELRAEARRAQVLLAEAAQPPSSDNWRSVEGAVQEWRAAAAATDPDCAVTVRQEPGSLPEPVVVELGRAAAECLRNAVRHAGAGARRGLAIDAGPRRVRLVVSDDGVGFDPGRVDPRRFGLRSSVAERIASLDGAEWQLSSQPGAGTVVELTWRC